MANLVGMLLEFVLELVAYCGVPWGRGSRDDWSWGGIAGLCLIVLGVGAAVCWFLLG